MIVQCDQCSTRFKLDDAKVKEEGVKVRCSKCKHIFVVKKETPHEEVEFESILGQLGSSPPGEGTVGADETPSAPFGADSPPQGAASETAETPGQVESSSTMKELDSWSPENIDVPPTATDTEMVPSEKTQAFDFERFNFGEESSSMQSPAPADTAERTDNEFDFDDVPVPENAFEVKDERENHDRSADFDSPSTPEGNVSWGGASAGEDLPFVFEKDVSGSAPPEPEGNPGLSVHNEFGSIDVENTTVNEEATEEAGAETFDFGSVDFGGAAPGEGIPAGSPNESFAEGGSEPGSRGGDEFFALSHAPDVAAPEDDLPPLSIASRRKGVTSAPIIVIVIAVVLVLALAGGGYFLTESPSGFEKASLGFMAKLVGLETKEDGGVSIRNAKGSFVVNKEAGELFVIRGEAVNNFRKPRASIQVKVVLYGPKGQIAAQKSAYCGNMLSDEQLATLPLAKVEEAMNNQFGDSLSNLGVQPGKGIPFVVVLNTVPKDVTEFGVEVVGSTVASR